MSEMSTADESYRRVNGRQLDGERVTRIETNYCGDGVRDAT